MSGINTTAANQSIQNNLSSNANTLSPDEMSDMLVAASVTLDESLYNTPWAIHARQQTATVAYQV